MIFSSTYLPSTNKLMKVHICVHNFSLLVVSSILMTSYKNALKLAGTEENEAKETVNVGVEQIRKIEAHYCDLCKMYLPRGDENEMNEILSRHCSQKVHRKRYLRLKESEKEKDSEKEGTEIKKEDEEKAAEPDSKADDNLDKDDKLWADVDKDLGDILAEAQSGNKSSDEDEEDSHVNGERYDRYVFFNFLCIFIILNLSRQSYCYIPDSSYILEVFECFIVKNLFLTGYFQSRNLKLYNGDSTAFLFLKSTLVALMYSLLAAAGKRSTKRCQRSG